MLKLHPIKTKFWKKQGKPLPPSPPEFFKSNINTNYMANNYKNAENYNSNFHFLYIIYF